MPSRKLEAAAAAGASPEKPPKRDKSKNAAAGAGKKSKKRDAATAAADGPPPPPSSSPSKEEAEAEAGRRKKEKRRGGAKDGVAGEPEKAEGTGKEKKRKEKKKKRSAEESAPVSDGRPAAAAAAADEAGEPPKRKKRKTEGEPAGSEDAAKPAGSAGPAPVSMAGVQDETPVEDSELLVTSYRISAPTVKKLQDRGVSSLFPIQAKTFNPIFDGKDLVGRARTGTGKTLAFALPMIERLLAEGSPKIPRNGPRVLVLAPTRELAKQVAEEFQTLTSVLQVECFYGGTPYQAQYTALRNGVDIIVGTPGRITDHLERGSLKLRNLRFLTLDECDQMLDIGFKDDMEKVINAAREAKEASADAPTHQILLFSATLPPWAKQVIGKYLAKDHAHVDLVGTQKLKTAVGVKHLICPTSWGMRAGLMADIVTVYGQSGRTIVFTNTKAEANELVLEPKLQKDSAVLHGDINQTQREQTLKRFKDSMIRTLICTDVAARGLDIPDVDLVVNSQPPNDISTYVHRSGRTGRAGRTGTCITFFRRNDECQLQHIAQKTGLQFIRMSPPQPQDIVNVALSSAAEQLGNVNKNALPFFASTAESLISEKGAVEALSQALAVLSGYSGGLPSRSLQTSQTGMTTILMKAASAPVRSVPAVINMITSRTGLAHHNIKAVNVTGDLGSVVFDIPSEELRVDGDDVYINGRKWEDARNPVKVAKELPALKPSVNVDASRGGGGGGGGRRPSFGRFGPCGAFGRGGGGARSGPSGFRGGSSGGRGSRRGGQR